MISDPNFDQELGISRIGEYLLKGMVLTDLNCSKCKIPTMRSKDRKVVGWCVLCDYVDPSVPVVKKARVVAADPGVNVSKELGVKLMQGWTMLQECCNNCVGVPLMRSQEEKCFCVSCSQWKSLDQNGVHDLNQAEESTVVDQVLQEACTTENVHDTAADLAIGQDLHSMKGKENLVADLVREDEELNKQLEEIYQDAPIQLKQSIDLTSSSTSVIKEKLELLSSMLAKATYPKEIQELCDAMKSASEALKSFS